ncbi:MAG: 23S rRNA (guanosine(2251)-2'-O)-methyltransferase RlmB [Succinivibrio sp.]|nr:23S rRNA (guanosine(2251)-2'-O)-methyltransferase RlmB [Succinivibrio sp.]
MAIQKKRSRNREIVYGINAVMAALQSEPQKITAAWVVKGREEDRRIAAIEEKLADNGIRAQIAMRHFLDEKTEGGVHQGIVIEMVATPPKDEHFLEDMFDTEGDESSKLFLILDGVTDPHNLGACMRSAWAAGAKAVIVPKDKSAPFSPVARKAASGAAAVLPLVAVTNLSRTIEFLKEHNVEVVGMAGEATDDIYAYGFQKSTAIVMGSEESGMRRLTREKCDAITKIPMAEGVESLNVSVAAGIALFEVVRQRRLN